jgi:hypothetical protein
MNEKLKIKIKKEKEIFSKPDKINQIHNYINSVGVIISILVSILISILGIRSTEKIAKKSGAFDKGELTLSFGGYILSPYLDFDVYYGVQISDPSLHFAIFPLVVHNTGEKTVDNIDMILKYPHRALLAIRDSMMSCESIISGKVDRKFQINGQEDLVAYPLDAINPKFSINIHEYICVHKEKLYVTTISMVQNNFKKDINTIYSKPDTIQVLLTAKDIATKRYSFNVSYRGESNIDKLIIQVIKEKLVTKDRMLRKAFFVVVPQVNEVYKDFNPQLTFMDAGSANTLFCDFDETMNYVEVNKPDGSIQRIDISKYQ